MLTGRASKGIAKLLEQRGLTLIAAPESFLVSKDNALQPGKEDRAQGWGEKLAARAMAAAARSSFLGVSARIRCRTGRIAVVAWWAWLGLHLFSK